jgi:hypothetical protein
MSDSDHEKGADRVTPEPDFFRELSIPLLAHELKGPLAVVEAGIRTLLARGAGEVHRRTEA